MTMSHHRDRTHAGSIRVTRALHRRITAMLMMLLLLTNIPLLPAPNALAQTTGQPCVDQGPAGGSYVAHVCFTTPGDGVVRGNVATNVSITAASGTLPEIRAVRFYFARAESSSRPSLLTDYASPWGLQIPTARWQDGLYRLQVRVDFMDDFNMTTYPRVMLDLQNGVTSDVHTNGSWQPKTSTASTLNLVAVGDGAGGLPNANDVGNLIKGMNPNLMLYLGDVYNAGTYSEFFNYYEPTLGALKSRTNPVPGNHETGNDFVGYMDYWNSDQHHYSFNSGGWHFIALDSTEQYAQTAAGTAQYNWLAQDLQANKDVACTMVFFHHPRYGLITTNNYTYMQDIWSLLALNGVDVVLNGHEHNYQRWKPMDANGQVVSDGTGMTQFVVGTGGHEQMPFGLQDSRVASRMARVDGALKLSLNGTGGTAQFVLTGGAIADSSSFTCHGGTKPAPPPPPAQPLMFEPVADALVEAARPTTNFGKTTTLRADTSPNEMSFLRFDVQAAEPITKATLRLYVADSSANAPSIAKSADVTWSETAITWNTRPAVGPTGPDLARVSRGTWIEYDVTSLVTGSGPVTLALVPQSSDGMDVNSREASSNRPQLVIQNGGSEPEPPPPPASTEYLVAADARVQETNPTTNYGTSTLLRADGGVDPDVETYLRFSVTGLTSNPTSAKIRLFVGTGSSAGSVDGPSLYTAPANWAEDAITWDTRPARGTTPVGDLGPVSVGTWVEYDVSAIVKGNGDFGFVLATISTDATDFNSRETASQPRLVIEGGYGTPTDPPPDPDESQALLPVADAMVQASNPDANSGKTTSMRSDQSPQEIAYMRFEVPATDTAVATAKLRLWVRDGTKDAPGVATSTDVTWSETGITWNNRPTPGATGPDLGAVTTSTWIEYDVTSLVTKSGPVTLVLVTQSSDALSVNTRESSTNKPELVITWSSDPATSPDSPIDPPTDPPTDPAPSSTLDPVADAMVREASPDGNSGKSTSMRADLDPNELSYIRFDIPASTQPITGATLRMWVRDGSKDAPAVATSADVTWGETTITWNNRPNVGTPGPDLGAMSTNTWIEYDVTSLVTATGPVTFVLVPQTNDALSVNTRENTTNTPQMVITWREETAPVEQPALQPLPADNGQLPMRATFYYPWFPDAWTQQGTYPYTSYTPSLGFYDVGDPAVLASQIDAMQYGNIQVGIASWWGPGTREDQRMPQLLSAAAGTGFTWAVYYEDEGFGTPTVDTIRADLTYLREHYAADDSYLRIDGKFVVFVYGGPGETCEMVDRWKEANTVDAYVVLKVFSSGWATCANQPDGWHQSSPATASDSQGTHSYTISPGFWQYGEAERLARDPARWQQNVRDMVASGADWQLVSTFNEWGEGTNVESADEWATASGHGLYLDVLHANGQGELPPIVSPETPQTTTLEPVADAMVLEAVPAGNNGLDPVLHADVGAGTTEMSYLRFNVQTGGGKVSKADLRLWVNGGSADGPAVAGSSDVTWGETTITWDTRPAVGDPIADIDNAPTGTWIEYDVTSLVTGDGSVTLALVPQSSDGLSANSREAVSDHPQLVVTYTGGSGVAAAQTLAPSAAKTTLRESAASPTATAPATPTTTVTEAPATPTATTTEAPSTSEPTATPTIAATEIATPRTGTVTNTDGDGVRLRTAPSADSDVLTVIPEGATVTIRGDLQDEWLPVSYAGQDGYVAAQYIAVTGDEPPAEQTTPDPVDAGETPIETVVPTEPAATPLPIGNGWSSDPNQPWTWLTDGNPATAWTTPDQGEAGVDLGQPVALDHLRLLPAWPLAGTLEIQLSNDGTTWFHLTDLRLADQAPDMWREVPVGYQARYIRFIISNPEGAVMVGALVDIELWAAPDGIAQPLDLLTPVTPTPAPTKVVPAEAPIVEPTAAPTLAPTAEPTVAPEPPSEPVADEPPAGDTQTDPGTDPEGSADGT